MTKKHFSIIEKCKPQNTVPSGKYSVLYIEKPMSWKMRTVRKLVGAEFSVNVSFVLISQI